VGFALVGHDFRRGSDAKGSVNARFVAGDAEDLPFDETR
jgi:hypothetical protein